MGIGVRAVSIALIPVLLGATFVHLGNGWVFSNSNGGWEYPAFLTLTSVVQALLGPGKFVVRWQQHAAPLAA
jgi:putative oxidoreductase